MPRRSRIEQERDRVRTSELYLKGWTQAQIAAEIGVTQAMISRNLQICRAEWKEITAMHIDDHKAKELAKIDTLEQTYWEAWQRSQDDVETRSSRMIGEGEESSPTKLERIVKVENQSGNEKYLAGVQWCINKRCEILGINAPTKIAQTDPTGNKQADNQVVIYIPSNGRERARPGGDDERPEDE